MSALPSLADFPDLKFFKVVDDVGLVIGTENVYTLPRDMIGFLLAIFIEGAAGVTDTTMKVDDENMNVREPRQSGNGVDYNYLSAIGFPSSAGAGTTQWTSSGMVIPFRKTIKITCNGGAGTPRLTVWICMSKDVEQFYLAVTPQKQIL
jgi:hypothetical protein